MHPALTDLVSVNPLLAELQKGISSGRRVIWRPREIKSARAYGLHGLYDVRTVLCSLQYFFRLVYTVLWLAGELRLRPSPP